MRSGRKGNSNEPEAVSPSVKPLSSWDTIMVSQTDGHLTQIEAPRRVPKGFRLLPGYVSVDQQAAIMADIHSAVPWTTCSPGHRSETYLTGLKTLPLWAAGIGERMVSEGIFPAPPDYLHLIWYDSGCGIEPHIDLKDVFSDVVAGLTLGSTRVMELTRRGRLVSVLLRPGDLYVLSGNARYKWKHGVPHQTVDHFRGEAYNRTDCFSVSWRIMKNAARATLCSS